MVPNLQDLPIEIVDITLQHLPLADLLSFARTSKANYQLSTQALTTLDLAIFPRRIHTLLSFFDAGNDVDECGEESEDDQSPRATYWPRSSANRNLHQIGLVTSAFSQPNGTRASVSVDRNTTPIRSGATSATSRPSSRSSIHTKNRPSLPHRSSSSSSTASTQQQLTPLSLRTAEITSQNHIATMVLSTPALTSLRHLSLRLYDLTSPSLATALATNFPALQSLSLDFSHPYIHDTILPARYWKETPAHHQGSPIWNALAGIGDANSQSLRLRGLRRLRLNRCGITSFQLRKWISVNPELRELSLNLVRGVDSEFVEWLGYYNNGNSLHHTSGEQGAMNSGKLEIIRLHDCGMLDIKKSPDFNFIDRLAPTDLRQTPSSGGLKELSLRGCKNVNDDVFRQLATGDANNDHSHKSWHGIRRLVSPKGTVFKVITTTSKTRNPATETPDVETQLHVLTDHPRNGSVSPALTVSDGMFGPAASGDGYFSTAMGKIEVDPAVIEDAARPDATW